MNIQQLLDRKKLLEQKLNALSEMLSADGSIRVKERQCVSIAIQDGGNEYRKILLLSDSNGKVGRLLSEIKDDFNTELAEINDVIFTMERVLKGLID